MRSVIAPSLCRICYKPLLKTLCRLVVSEEQHRGFAECPLQVSVTDLVVSALHAFTCRFMGTLDQSSIRDEVAYRREPADVVDLIKYEKR